LKLKSLHLDRPGYGPNSDKLRATIQIDGKTGSTTLILPDSVADSIIELAKDAIIDAVESSANDFIFELTTAFTSLKLPPP
jgi:hypothetical protein